jgi:predicted aldo/keto reductase-like oxidoreductase
MKCGISGLAATCLTPFLWSGKMKKAGDMGLAERKIISRTLGRTGLKVPIVSFGCGFVDESHLVYAAQDAGITHFDTAPGYGGGKSESVLGEVLKSEKRDSFILASKIGLSLDNRTGLLRSDMTPQKFKTYIISQLDTRLKLLQTDYLDILYLYDVANPELVADPMVKEVLSQVKKEGKARFVGISFHQNEPAMIRACVEQKIYDVVLTAYNFRQPHRDEVKKAVAEASSAGLGVVAMKFMAGVYWDRERRNPINAKAALKWLLQDENVHTVVAGMKSFDEIEENVSVMADLALTPQERKDLKSGNVTGLSGLYCSQCGLCRSQCIEHLDIPTAMRSYMYAYGYGDPALAKKTLLPLSGKMLFCEACSSCEVSCPMGFDVSGKMRDIARILSVPDEFLA